MPWKQRSFYDRFLITFKHLQNIHPHIHDWPGDTGHAEIWVKMCGWYHQKTVIFFLGRSVALSHRASASWSFPCGGRFHAADVQSPFCGGQFPPGDAASVQPAAPSPCALCTDGQIKVVWVTTEKQKDKRWEKREREQDKRGTEIRTAREGWSTFGCCKRKKCILEVHLLLSGLFLPHGSTCLSDGPSSTTTFSCTFTQLTQLRSGGGSQKGNV